MRWEVLAYRAARPPGHGYVLRLCDRDGGNGVGEARALEGFGSFPQRLDDFLTNRVAIQRLLDTLQDEGCADHALDDVPVEALFAAETALTDLSARREGKPLVEYLGFANTDALTNSTLVTNESEALPLLAAGHHNFKLKARGADQDCLALAWRLVDESNGAVRLRIDANGTWDRVSARDFIASAPRDAIVFIEQPFPIGDLESCAWLQEYADIPVALDEGAESPDAIADAARAGAARLVIVKPMYRGLRGGLRLATAAAEHGLGACVTHAMDGTVGRVATMHVAAAVNAICGDTTWPHGLYAPGLTSLADEPLLEPDRLSLPRGAGLGCTGLRDADLTLVCASQ